MCITAGDWTEGLGKEDGRVKWDKGSLAKAILIESAACIHKKPRAYKKPRKPLFKQARLTGPWRLSASITLVGG